MQIRHENCKFVNKIKERKLSYFGHDSIVKLS